MVHSGLSCMPWPSYLQRRTTSTYQLKLQIQLLNKWPSFAVHWLENSIPCMFAKLNSFIIWKFNYESTYTWVLIWKNHIAHNFLEVFGQVIFIPTMFKPVSSNHHLDEWRLIGYIYGSQYYLWIIYQFYFSWNEKE